jgi:hypothetical protein
MRRGSNPALPRVRLSFPGTSGDKLGSKPWAAVLLLCGMLMLVGCAHVAGRLRLRQLLEASFQSSSAGGGGGNGLTSSGTIASRWSKAPLGISSSIAAAVGDGAEADKLQHLQQGMDFGGISVNPRLHQGSSSSNNTSVSALTWRPKVHGRVRKAGMTDPQAWLSNFTDARLDSFLSWRLNRTRADGATPAAAGAGADAATCAAADHPPLPFPGCHVFVNHQYKYIYVRSPKAASTSIVNVLGECDNVRTRGHNSSSCMALHFYWPKAAMQLEELQDTWRDYFVFGFVRNPWRRAYSLYKYIHSSGCMSECVSWGMGVWGARAACSSSAREWRHMRAERVCPSARVLPAAAVRRSRTPAAACRGGASASTPGLQPRSCTTGAASCAARATSTST